MPFSVSASPRISTEGDGVTITGEAYGGDSDGRCVKVGYDGDSSSGSSSTFKPKPGSYTPFAEFTTPLGGSERVTGSYFEVTEKSKW
jgi:hypothetical protein